MTNLRRACLWVLLCLALRPPIAAAQAPPTEPAPAGPPPAHISLIEGQAFIDRDGRSDPAVENLPLLDGDRLRVDSGRVEVILSDGSLLHLDQDTVIDVLAPDLLRLLQGRVLLAVRGAGDPGRAVRYQIDAPAASVQTGGPGEYRIFASDNSRGREIELAVFRGQATLANDLGAQDARAGERVFAREGFAPSEPQYFNSARWDAFDRWSATRRETQLGGVSVQYLPDDLDGYASSFDRYGTWRNEPTYGNVWYPDVSADWRPYSAGYWREYPTWGSFWIDSEPWGWPTHHYGRWGLSARFGWYWMPDRAWAPAWVYWALSPGYVSWCALGYDNYPVFGHWGVHGMYSGHGYDPWRGWLVMSRQHFRSSMPVRRYAVDGRRLDPSSRGAFVAQRRSPLGYAGGTAGPRGLTGRSGQPSSPTWRDRGDMSPAYRGDSRRTTDMAVPRGGASGSSGLRDQATRRSYATDTPRAGVPRTEAPVATPDTSAFRSRRDAAPRQWTTSDSPGGASADEPYRARSLPDSWRPIRPRSGNQPSADRQAPAASPGANRDSASPRAGFTERPRSDTPRYEAPRYEAPRYQAPRNEAPRYEAPRYEAPRYQAPRYEAPRYEAPRATPPREAPRYEAPRAAPPREAPRYEAPRATPPREAPRYEAPRAAPPREAPRYEAPRSAPPQRSEPSYRSDRPSGGSSGAAAPRYNPGAGSARPRGGGAAPPSRRRGGAPGQ